jgi:hypothetical protein
MYSPEMPIVMKLCQTLLKKSTQNRVKKSKKKTPKQGREKETWDKDKSPGKHTAPQGGKGTTKY